MDPQGSQTGSNFTITVNDSNPHFFYSIRDLDYWINDCSSLESWASQVPLPDNTDVLFALNPVIPHLISLTLKNEAEIFDGYKSSFLNQKDLSMTFPNSPHEGQFAALIGCQASGGNTSPIPSSRQPDGGDTCTTGIFTKIALANSQENYPDTPNEL